MEKQFVPYKLALKLKELGFDLDCMYAWCQVSKGYPVGKLLDEYVLRTDGNPFGQYYAGKNWNRDIEGRNKNNIRCSAPLWQQAFDWFRENHNLAVYPLKYKDWYFCIDNIDSKVAESIFLTESELKPTYEEARVACLEKLTELVNK